jgi:hypothetical protein
VQEGLVEAATGVEPVIEVLQLVLVAPWRAEGLK